MSTSSATLSFREAAEKIHAEYARLSYESGGEGDEHEKKGKRKGDKKGKRKVHKLREKPKCAERFKFNPQAAQKMKESRQQRQKRKSMELQDDASTPLRDIPKEDNVDAYVEDCDEDDDVVVVKSKETPVLARFSEGRQDKHGGRDVGDSPKLAKRRKKDVEELSSRQDDYFSDRLYYHGNAFPVHEVYANVDTVEWDETCFELPKFVQVGPDYATDNYPRSEEHEDNDEINVSQSFKAKLEKVLGKPFDEMELMKMTNNDGLNGSYLDIHTVLAKTLKREERLRLLRGFFFWIKHKRMEDSFRPWLETGKEIIELD